MKKIILLILWLSISFVAYPHKVTVCYTGNTFSTLYPCGYCPASVGGGVSRRATAIEEIKKNNKNVILIDGGNFVYAGPSSAKETKQQFAKERTLIYLNTMAQMKYDAIGIGAEDISLGLDFLRSITENFELKFISSNIELKGVHPHLIKDFGDFKIGLIGLSPLSMAKESDLKVGSYLSKLKRTFRYLRRKVDFIILVSSLGDVENIALAKKFPEIKLILSSGPVSKIDKSVNVGKTVIITPAARGKSLRVVDLDVKNNRINDWKVQVKRLPLDLKEDPKIKASVPACFTDSDCSRKKGLVARCQNPGEITSLCGYYEAKQFEAIIITDKDCSFCSVDFPQAALRQHLLGISFKVLDYRQPEAKELIAKYDIVTLPSFILPIEVKDERGFANLSKFLKLKNGKYLLDEKVSGISLVLNRKPKSNQIDFFLDFNEPNSKKLLNDLVKFSRKNNVNLNIYFVIPEEPSSSRATEEIELALAVKDLYPSKFADYLLLRLQNRQSLFWMNPLETLGIDIDKVKALVKSKRIKQLVKDNKKIAEDLNVLAPNVIVINNIWIFKVVQINDKDLKNFFKTTNKK